MRLGFRLKLVLAMMSVVVLGTGSSLFVAQQRVQAAYQRLFEEQFRSQFERFAEAQDARLSGVKEKCLDVVTHSVRLRAAVEENDGELLYSVATDELRGLEGQGTRRSRPVYFEFFDSQGQPVPRPGIQAPKVVRREAQQRLIRQMMANGSSQELGVAPLFVRGDREQLCEWIATRIPGVEETQPQGALLVAFPAVLPGGATARTLERNGEWAGERSTNRFAGRTARSTEGSTNRWPERMGFSGRTGQVQTNSNLRFGIWSAGQLYVREEVLPTAEVETVRAAMDQFLASATTSSGEFRMVLGDQPQRVIYQPLGPVEKETIRDGPYQVGIYSLAESERQQQELRQRILLLGGVALLAALLLSLVLAHGLSVPIHDLVGATTEVRQGNFKARVPVRSPDELGQLAGAFNEMTEGLELKERYRTVLNSVADERVAQQLLEGGLTLGGEERRVSVVFCDIRGFTAHTENMAAREIVDMLNEHMTALTRVVKVNQGVLDKYVGDLLMAVFGAPLSSPQDALDAARCALGLIAERARLNETSKHQLAVGVGLATGQVVAGCMGSVDRLDYTVIGERVNLASRLCSLAKAGQVVMDGATRELLGDRAVTRTLPPVRLKGFSEEVQAFELVALVGQRAES